MSDRHGMIWWSELMTRNATAAREYYARVAGWKFDPMPMGGATYLLAKRGETPIAGIMDLTAIPGMEEAPTDWFTYIAVDDVDAAVAATREMGGQVMREVFEVQGVGRIAIVKDPSGAAVGIMTPAGGPEG